MPRIDSLDEAIIDSEPTIVYKAILNELAGVTHWWMPHFESKLRGDIPIDHEGAVFDITLHGTGTPKFSGKITRISEAKSVEIEYSGDLAGTGEWIFEPTGGKTRLQKRFNVSPKRLSFVILSPFLDIRKRNSDTMQKGFKALNIYLSKK